MIERETGPVDRLMIASRRDKKARTVVVRDTLPALAPGEIRLSVEKVGLSTNNLFYAQMGDVPGLRFFAVYPIAADDGLANVPAWGLGRVVATRHPEFAVGQRFRGFLHMTNVVQMRAKRTAEGFKAYGDGRDKLVPAYNAFVSVDEGADSPFLGEGPGPDLAMAAAPGAISGHILYELLEMRQFYEGDAVALTSASSKVSLSVASSLRAARDAGRLDAVVGYTSPKNRGFVEATGLFDRVLTYDEPLPGRGGQRYVFVDVAGDASVYRKNRAHIVKALAVGGTHSSAKTSTFKAFRPSGLLKMGLGLAAPKKLAAWADRNLNPHLEMFFAPGVLTELVAQHGHAEVARRSERALAELVDTAIGGDWIGVTRCEDTDSAQEAYRRIFAGDVPPSEAVVVALAG